MSRRSNRNRGRSAAVKAAPPGGAAFSAAQVAAMMNAQRQLATGNMRASPLATSPLWETAPFGPGRRLMPAPINTVREDTRRAEPRLWEYPVSWNLQIDDRWHVPWKTLQSAADMPLFRKCIERRKSVCQLDFTVTVDPKAVAREAQASGSAVKDVESGLRKQYMAEISRITDWLQVPDRKNDLDWAAWTSLLMENRLKFDAAVVYPRRTYGGDLFALEIIDGKTIKPLLDEYGGRPMPPYPAFQQIMYGFPRGEFVASTDNPDDSAAVPGGFTADQLYYERSIYRSESPYGMSATEIALLDGLVWMRRMGWILAEYTEGVLPAGILETGPETEWTPTQWEDWQRALNDHLGGNTAERHKWPLTPPGVKLVVNQEVAERYKPDYDLFLIKLIAGDFGLPASEVGFTEAGALGASFHEGEEDILNRQTRRPDAQWLSNYATKIAIRQLAMPGVLRVQVLGLESEDEAAADAVAGSQVGGARMTLNEDRARRGEPPYSFAEADMPMLISQRGIVFLEGASTQAPPGTLIGPAQAPPAGMPGSEQHQDDDDDDDDDPPASKSLRSAAARLGAAAGEAAQLARTLTSGDDDAMVSKAAERAALRNWLAKPRNQNRTFECRALTVADAPQWANNPRVVFKAGGDPKAPWPRGLAGSGTRSS
jgi:hypothetical protein